MKKYLTCAITCMFATITVSIAAPDKDALEAKEKAAWQAFKDKNAGDFKKLVSADVVAVYDDGMFDMEKELSTMEKWDMKSFAISDYKITSFGSDTVISTYKVKVEGTYEGKDASGAFNAGSVWRMEKGGWMAIFHTNVKEAPAAK